MVRLLFISLLCLRLGVAASVDAFLVKDKGWNPHPDLKSLAIGPGTVVVLKADGASFRYTGEIWEYTENGGRVYELQTHAGFVLEGGTWSSTKGMPERIDFTSTIAEKTVPATVTPTDGVMPSRSCTVGGPLGRAKHLQCGTRRLVRVKLRSVPTTVEAALNRLKGK